MILWPNAKRSISTEVAAEIATITKAKGARPVRPAGWRVFSVPAWLSASLSAPRVMCWQVGVFVDEDAETIVRKCKAAGISIAQLHGDGAR